MVRERRVCDIETLRFFHIIGRIMPAKSRLRRLVLSDRDTRVATQDGERKSNRSFITGHLMLPGEERARI